MARSVIEYRDFSAGEFGRKGAWRAPKNSFAATNMLVYQTGELGVRAGLKNVTPAGWPNGALTHLLTHPTFDRAFAVLATTRKAYWLDIDLGTFAASAGTFVGTPTVMDPVVRAGTSAYISVAGDTTYSISDAAVIAGLAGTPPTGNTLAVYGERLIIGTVVGGLPYRLRYSDAGNYGSWPAANFIDVGDTRTITGIWPQRTHLLISKAEGGWYVLTGVPGVNDTLRQVSTALGPSNWRGGALDAQDNLHYRAWNEIYPARFTGSQDIRDTHLEVGHVTFDGAVVVPLRQGNRGVVYSSEAGAVLANINRTWSKHTFSPLSATVNGLCTDIFTTTPGIQHVLFATDGAAGSPAAFYVWRLQDSPGIEGSENQKAGDDSTSQVSGSVSFPEWHSEGGQEVTVRAVVVDFRSWNTGGSLTNHFDVKVDAMRLFDASSPRSSSTQSFDQVGSDSSATGTLQRRVFTFGSQGMGNGLQLHFTNVRGVALQRIQVILDTQPARFV